MSILIILTITLVILHLVYDRVVLPTIRFHLRNRLFKLKDEVRMMMIKEGKTEQDEAFMYVHDGICKLLNRLPEITLHLQAELEKQLSTNKQLREDVKHRIELINESGNHRLQGIFKETNNIVEKTFIANAGAWLLYLVPIALLFTSISKLSEIAKELVVMPTRDTEHLIPITN